MDRDERYRQPGYAYGTEPNEFLGAVVARLPLGKTLSLAELKEELAGLEFLHAVQIERDVIEGSRYTGPASLIQVLGIKP